MPCGHFSSLQIFTHVVIKHLKKELEHSEHLSIFCSLIKLFDKEDAINQVQNIFDEAENIYNHGDVYRIQGYNVKEAYAAIAAVLFHA